MLSICLYVAMGHRSQYSVMTLSARNKFVNTYFHIKLTLYCYYTSGFCAIMINLACLIPKYIMQYHHILSHDIQLLKVSLTVLTLTVNTQDSSNNSSNNNHHITILCKLSVLKMTKQQL